MTIVADENWQRLWIAVLVSTELADAGRKALRNRQASIVRLIADGRTTKEIARILNISLKTVATHRATAMRRLHPSLPGRVRYAVRNGLIEP
jgi:DNA-binding NarL/FixJ family response regulator